MQLSHHQHARRLKYRGVKKASSAKPDKSPKSIVDVFKGLPADDIEFIQQLDKQFEKFGNNIRIKVEQENRTTAKNAKRTIDGNLGWVLSSIFASFRSYGDVIFSFFLSMSIRSHRYGYNSHQAEDHSGYYFSKPKFQIYPYSQHDIAPTPEFQHLQQYLKHNQPQALVSSTVESQSYYQQSQNGHTSVEIQPSRSYEIKETPHGYQTLTDSLEQQDTAEYHHQVPTEQQPDAPVIVLRIPGPPKYATHLRALLQQYLEIRAAQYIQALQEQEAQQRHHHQQQEQQQIQHIEGKQNSAGGSYASDGDSYQPDQLGQVYSAPAPQAYDVPPNQYADELPPEVPVATHNADEQAYVQMDNSAHDGPSAAFVYQALQNHAQEQVVYAAHRQPVENPLDSYGVPHQPIVSPQLLTSENYPDDKHTQVVFRSTTQQPPAYQYDSVHLNSQSSDAGNAEVQTFRAPLVYHRLEQFYGSQPDYERVVLQQPVNRDLHAEHHHNGGSNDESAVSPSSGSYLAITQRPVLPYNYHAQTHSSNHPHKFHSHYNGDEYPMLQSNNLYKRNSSKRHAHPHSDTPRSSPVDRQRKFTNLMHRLKARAAASTRYDTIPL